MTQYDRATLIAEINKSHEAVRQYIHAIETSDVATLVQTNANLEQQRAELAALTTSLVKERDALRSRVAELDILLREAQDSIVTYSRCPACNLLVACSGVPCRAGHCTCGYNVTESEIETVDVVERVAELEARLTDWLAQAKCEDDPALLAETARVLGHETKPAQSVRECLEKCMCLLYELCKIGSPHHLNLEALERVAHMWKEAKQALAAPGIAPAATTLPRARLRLWTW